MGSVVVGIFPGQDSLAKLTDAIKAQGLHIDRLRVVSSDTLSDDLIGSGAQFYSGDAEPEAIGEGGGIITGFGGTGVPGLSSSVPGGGVSRTPSTDELLSEMDIPDRRMPEFENALESGRTVAGYNAGDDVERVKQLFASAGAAAVEVF